MVEELKKEETVKNESKEETKFCVHCGKKIPIDAVICTKCGRQVEEIKKEKDQIVINNNNTANSVAVAKASGGYGRPRNKWVAFCLCLFLGYFGAHKFYEGKAGMGVLYLCTGGLCGIGWLVDTIILLLKPNPYYV